MAIEPKAWLPDWAVSPGEVLLELLEERGISQSELARRTDRPIKTVNEIVNGRAAITPATAIQLERALGVTARFWSNLEVAYREHLARIEAENELEDLADWIKKFPIRDLLRLGLVQTGRSNAQMLADLLSFFGVSSPKAWERHWAHIGASFRESPAFKSSPEAVAVWLRWGEIEAGRITCEPFDATRFRHELKVVRHLTIEKPFASVINEVRSKFASAGVALVLLPELKGTHLSGAARWLSSSKALLQLSLRHKRDDQFWFSLFHEAGHLLLPRRRLDFVDGADGRRASDEEEEQADAFARTELIPQEQFAHFIGKGDFSRQSVRSFAYEVGVSPGIVAGRLQRDGLVPRDRLNDLKQAVRLVESSYQGLYGEQS